MSKPVLGGRGLWPTHEMRPSPGGTLRTTRKPSGGGEGAFHRRQRDKRAAVVNKHGRPESRAALEGAAAWKPRPVAVETLRVFLDQLRPWVPPRACTAGKRNNRAGGGERGRRTIRVKRRPRVNKVGNRPYNNNNIIQQQQRQPPSARADPIEHRPPSHNVAYPPRAVHRVNRGRSRSDPEFSWIIFPGWVARPRRFNDSTLLSSRAIGVSCDILSVVVWNDRLSFSRV